MSGTDASWGQPPLKAQVPEIEEETMVAKCANPDCSVPFLYLREGKLFAIPRPGVSVRATRVEYFWLCGNCAGKLAIDSRRQGGMRLTPWNAKCAQEPQPV
jgi:hypothetical protein